MDSERFWVFIENARRESGGDEEAFLTRLHAALVELEPEEILGFRDVLAKTLERANNFELRGAAYLMNGERSEDGFEQFRGWIVARGRDVFERALEEPDSLAEHVPEDPEADATLEELLYLPIYVYEEQTGKQLELPESWQTGLLSEPSGEPLSAEELDTRLPKVSERVRRRG